MKKEHQLILSFLKDYIPKCEKHLESLNEMIGLYADMEDIAKISKTDFNVAAEKSVLQFNFLLTNSDLELNLIFKNLLNSEYKWERIYFLKLAGLNIYETLKAYNKHRKPIKEIA